VNRPELHYRKAGERRAKQHKRAKATIEPASDTEVEKRHGMNPCCGELKSGKRTSPRLANFTNFVRRAQRARYRPTNYGS
jgi:hypothetical protein